jgi:hypothetical protein
VRRKAPGISARNAAGPRLWRQPASVHYANNAYRAYYTYCTYCTYCTLVTTGGTHLFFRMSSLGQ